MKVVEEQGMKIVVECEKCGRMLDVDRSQVSASDKGYKGRITCECKNISNITGSIVDRYKIIQNKIDSNLGRGKNKNPGCMIILIALVLSFIASVAIDPTLGVLIFITSFIASLVVFTRERKSLDIRRAEELKQAESEYQRIRSGIDIPDNKEVVTYLEGNLNLLQGKQYIWLYKDTFMLFPSEAPHFNISEFIDKIQLVGIPVKNIDYFAVEGEVFHENKVSGGGGGGSSLGGAILGGAVAGPAGAIIFSRKGNREIKSKLIVHDKRRIKIKYRQESGNTEFIYFAYTDLNVFEKLMPDKNYDLLRSGKMANTAAAGGIPVHERLRELAKLRSKGVLTDEEYERKKNELLKEF